MKAFFALTAALLAVAASAAELRVPQGYDGIQAAIDASRNGDVVLVGPGIYREPLNMRGRAITLRSTAGPSVTFLDGTPYESSILTVRSGETLATRVEGFTFRNGFGTTPPACNLGGRKGGAIFALNASISVANCIFESNGADSGRGGAIFGCSAGLAIDSSSFTRNRAAHGAGIYYLGLSTRRLTVERSTFRENGGGAIDAVLFQNSALTILDSQFDGNGGSGTAGAGAGGALSVEASGATRVDVARTAFNGNRASHGGAIFGYFTSSAKASFTNCQFNNGVAAFGGGMNVNAIEDAVVDLTACDFRGHEAAFGGGLFAMARGTPGLDPGGRIRINGCRFFDNVAHACCNAGLIIDTCFTDGPPPRGDGRYFGGGADIRTGTGGSVTVANSLFAGNSATEGGGVHAGSCAGGTIDFVNCTVTDNDTGIHMRLGTPQLVGATGVSAITVTNSIVHGNDRGAIGLEHDYAPSSATVSFSDVEGGFAGVGNFDLQPAFVDPAARDYRLADGSACIDAGDNGAVENVVAEDLAGRPRLADDPKTRDRGAGTSPQVDLGAYEFQPEPRPRRRSTR